jgi:hypothetical protein
LQWPTSFWSNDGTQREVDVEIRDDSNIRSELCGATGLESSRAWSSLENVTKKILREVIARNGHLRTHNSPKKDLHRNFSGNENVGDAFFLSRIITSDESCAHHYDTLTKRQWNSMNSRRYAEIIEDAECCGLHHGLCLR